MASRYLLCPACGGHRFFLQTVRGEVYFHVGPDRQPFPTEVSNAELAGLDFSRFGCTGCSWKGGVHKLVKIFAGMPAGAW